MSFIDGYDVMLVCFNYIKLFQWKFNASNTSIFKLCVPRFWIFLLGEWQVNRDAKCSMAIMGYCSKFRISADIHRWLRIENTRKRSPNGASSLSSLASFDLRQNRVSLSKNRNQKFRTGGEANANSNQLSTRAWHALPHVLLWWSFGERTFFLFRFFLL